MENLKEYWFQNYRTIRFGKPIRWQGWAVIIAYCVLVLVPLFIRPFLGVNATLVQVTNQAFWTVILIVITIKKGRSAEKKEAIADEPEEYWFPKNESGLGIGYGFPDTWQGMLVYLVVFVGMFVPILLKPVFGKYALAYFLVNALFWAIFLIYMNIKHGEK